MHLSNDEAFALHIEINEYSKFYIYWDFKIGRDCARGQYKFMPLWHVHGF